MCLLKDMCVYLILLVDLSDCMDMTGEVGVRLDVPGDMDGSWLQELGKRQGVDFGELVLEMHPLPDNVRRRREPTSEKTKSHNSLCTYQYPKKKQVDALLSNMMNELTKIFVRAREVLEQETSATVRADSKEGSGGEKREDEEKRKDEGKPEDEGKGEDVGKRDNARESHVKPGSRFHVVSSKNSAYFDVIYSNMTEEYRKFYAEAALGTAALRSRQDPCKNQAEIKELWQNLLNSSLVSLKKASLRCVKLYLRTAGRSRDSKAKNKLGMFLLKEFRKLRSYQLDTLCDLFKMCYKELLEDDVRITEKKRSSY